MRFLLCLFVLVVSAVELSAQSPDVQAAQITWFGAYEVSEVKIIDDPTQASGRRREGGIITPPSRSDDRIEVVGGRYFGFGYRLLGSPAGTQVPLRYVRTYPAPGFLHQQTGKYITRDEQDLNLRIGQPDLFMGYVLSADAPLGTYTFQIWHGNSLLVEKAFTIYRP
jgi:hypothetical protein